LKEEERRIKFEELDKVLTEKDKKNLELACRQEPQDGYMLEESWIICCENKSIRD